MRLSLRIRIRLAVAEESLYDFNCQDVDGRIILRWIFRKWEGVVGDWMELAQDRDRWRTLVSTVMKFRGSITCGEFLD